MVMGRDSFVTGWGVTGEKLSRLVGQRKCINGNEENLDEEKPT
jgi:hypothetical protein